MVSFESIALNKLMRGDVELIPEISIDYFSGKHQKIFKLMLEYYSDHSKLPDVTTLKATIESRAPVAVRGGFAAMVDAAYLTDSSMENDALVSSLRDAHILRNVDSQIEELLEAQRSKDAPKVKALLAGLLEDLSIQNVSIDEFRDAIEVDDHFTVAPSGLGVEFDELIGGGFSGLTVITAKSGGGKSILLQQSAIESFKSGLNVLYLSLELSGKVLGNRVKSYISGVPFGTINTGKTSEAEKKLIKDSMDEVFEGKKNTWRMTTSPVDTDELLNIIKVEKQLHDINVVVIDYLALVSPSKYDRGEGWITISNLVKKLHRYTMQENVVIVTASQVNEVKKAKDGVEPEITTRGSKEIEFSATQMYYLENSEVGGTDDGSESQLTLYQLKNRLAKKVHSIITGDFSIMKVTDTGFRIN